VAHNVGSGHAKVAHQLLHKPRKADNLSISVGATVVADLDADAILVRDTEAPVPIAAMPRGAGLWVSSFIDVLVIDEEVRGSAAIATVKVHAISAGGTSA